jgi:hypothetical protein
MNPEPKQETAAEPRQWKREDFKSPPVKSRHFLIQLDISKQDFEQKINSLLDAIQKQGHFDERGMKAQWDFRLELLGKTPKPKVLLTHIPMVTRSAADKKPKTVVELLPPIGDNLAQLRIQQDCEGGNASRFEDLQDEIHSWLPLVMEHFNVSRVGGFLLEYRNLIERERYPMFWEGGQTLQLGRILWLFQHNPGPGNFVTPFSVEFNSAIPQPNIGSIRFHMTTVQQSNQEFGLQVMLAYNSLARSDKRNSDDSFEELAIAHGLLFENFVRQFAQSALEVFTQ